MTVWLSSSYQGKTSRRTFREPSSSHSLGHRQVLTRTMCVQKSRSANASLTAQSYQDLYYKTLQNYCRLLWYLAVITKTTVLVTAKLTKAYGSYPSNRCRTASPTAQVFQLNKSYLSSRWAPASLSKPSQSLSFTDKLMSKRAWASKYYLPMQSFWVEPCLEP